MKRDLLIGALTVIAGTLLAADAAKDEVTKAAAKLAEQANYTWTTTVTVPEGTRFRPGPTTGTTEKDGFTHVTMTFGDNKTQMAFKGEKGVATNADGEWQAASEFENAEGPARWTGMMLRNFKLPSAQATEVVGFTKDLKKDGEAYSGTLTEDGVKNLLRFRRSGGNPPEVKDPSGSAKFWVKDGVLTKYEYQVKGSMNFNGNDVQMDRTTTVEFKDVGKTKSTVPEEAKKKLS